MTNQTESSLPTIDRRTVSFAQAEGVDPLPTQLALRQISKGLAAALWNKIYEYLDFSKLVERTGYVLSPAWRNITKDWYTDVKLGMLDEYRPNLDYWISDLKGMFGRHNYLDILEFIQFVARHPNRPSDFRKTISGLLEKHFAAYVLIDDTIHPKASSEEGAALVMAHAVLKDSPYQGARTHLKAAGAHLSRGEYSSSVRESISAIEGIVMAIDPESGKLSNALAKLEQRGAIHSALKKAFCSLYGYSSDQEGVRHALIFEDTPNVDEADALFMLGACASFITFVVSRTS